MPRLVMVDSNEQSTAPQVVAQLREYFGKTSVVVIPRLPAGDLAVGMDGTNVLRVERKTPDDFLASIKDGRLSREVDGMVKSKAWSAVVVTGEFDYDVDDWVLVNGERTGWHGTAVRAALRSVQWAGALVEYCAPGFYARTVGELISLASKPEHAHYAPTRRKHSPVIDFYPDDTAIQERVEFLMGLPGVGAKMARSVLDWCGSRDHSRVGSVAECLVWITVFPYMDNSDLPEHWSPRKSEAAAEFIMHGSEGEYLKLAEMHLPTEEATS